MRQVLTKFKSQVLTLVLTIAALMVGQSAWAESTWTVTNDNGNSNTFTIKRSEMGYAQTVHFRTISLSAYAGQHFTAVDMDYTFPADEDTKTVTVSEKTPSGAYVYQTADSRKYGFEVTDRAGFRLAYAERKRTWGTSVPSSGLFNEKTGTIQSSEFWIDDSGYKQTNSPHTINRSSFYTDAEKNYLVSLGVPLHMTLELQAKEEDDAYEYLQVLIDNTTGCDSENDADKGNPGTPSLSRYMAGFEMDPSDTYTTYKTYTFPVANVADGTKATNPWGYGTDFPLSMQKFKSGYRSDDYKIIVPNSFNTITVRFDASGSKGSDKWWIRNLKAKLTAIDNAAPVFINNYKVSGGRHQKGNTIYVSVAFSEIVTVSGTPKLTSNWGDLSYVAGSGTNVLTFSTTIPQDATGSLNITGLSGTVKDLAGNSLSGGVTASNLCTLDDDFAYTINDFQQEGGNYLIKTHEDLIGLAGYVNGGGATKDKTFLQVADITFAHTTDWNSSSSTENNYTAIGYYKASDDQKNFEGTYDGGGHTISGIRIYRNNNTNSDNYQGLFGHVKSNGAIRNVNLSDTRITGRSTVGGIVGYNMCTVEDCTVAANVCIHQIYGGSIHGGVVGYNLRSVKRCISSAHLTVKNDISTSGYGGIVGRNENTITDCIATDVVIPDVNARGAIVGVLYDNGTLTRNYYHGCKVASDNVTPSGVGQGTADKKTTSDETGAQPLWAITLPTHASVVRTGTALPGTDNATYDNGADINGVPYAKGLSVVNLSYDPATITEGYDVLLSVKQTSDDTAVAFTDNGNHTYTIASMPAADITVSVTEIPIIAYIDADGNPQSHACTPIVEGTTSYQTLGRTEGWYVVNTDVTISGTQGVKFLDQQVNIILCDGTTLTSNATTTGYNGIEVKNGSLAIYGQSLGTGSIVATASNYSAISSKTSINLNGGIISGITNSGYAAITNDSGGGGSITIRRGNVTATGLTFGIRDLGESSGIVILGGTVNATATHATNGIGLYSAYGDISILGGNVTATASCAGIEAGGSKATTITLGCTTPADRITASSYDCATLTITDGQILSDGTDTYSGTLSSEQKTAIAGKTLSAAIPYIDADGTTKYKASKDLTFITTSTRNYGNAANSEGWYCVNSDVNFTDNVLFNDQMVNIILCDGATLSSEKYSNYYLISANNGSLAIYGQTHGTGTLSLNCTASGSAILANSNIDINGGTINASSPKGIGIKANNAITIRRGNITAKGNEYGIMATTITLGCATTADRIYATGYKGTVTIADGQTLTDGYSANTYANTLTDEQKNAIKKKTMMKALGDVSYIDENGQEQICNNYKILSDGIYDSVRKIGESSKDTWYVASGNYTFNASYLETCGRVHLILCDGASFTVNGSGSYGINAAGNLTIYGQSQGTGTLTANVANASGKALYISSGNLVVNGGVVSAHGGEYGIYINKGNLTVNGGTVNATGTTKDIYVSSGTMELVNDNGTWTASFSDSSTETINIPTNITVDNVSLNRTFTANKAATLMLPFAIDVANTSGAAFYTYTGVTFDTETNKWKATMTQVTSGTIAANTPYVVMPTGTAITFTGSVTLNTTGGGGQQTTNGDWTFKGTYEKKTWTAADCGNDYGFAATSGTATDGVTDVEAGDFVKLAAGAWIRPMRAYLTYTGTGNPWAGARRRADAELPQSISVILVSANGETTEIDLTPALSEGEGAWYTLDGRKLDKQPTTKGLYINNGKKTVIK